MKPVFAWVSKKRKDNIRNFGTAVVGVPATKLTSTTHMDSKYLYNTLPMKVSVSGTLFYINYFDNIDNSSVAK